MDPELRPQSFRFSCDLYDDLFEIGYPPSDMLQQQDHSQVSQWSCLRSVVNTPQPCRHPHSLPTFQLLADLRPPLLLQREQKTTDAAGQPSHITSSPSHVGFNSVVSTSKNRGQNQRLNCHSPPTVPDRKRNSLPPQRQ